MLGRAAGFVAATYALGANGILLPPGVNSIDDSLSIPAETAKSQVVRVSCPHCAFSTKQAQADSATDGEDAVFGIEGDAKDLLLNFTTSEDRRRLLVNGAAIYPPLAHSSSDRVIVDQVPASGDGVRVPVEITSSGLGMDHEPSAEDEENLLMQLRYTVFGVEKQLMELQDVKIDLLKTAGELLIIEAAVDRKEKPSLPPHPIHHGPPPAFRPPFAGPPHGLPSEMTNDKECNMLPAPVCRFKHMLESKIAHMRHGKPCPGRLDPPHGRLPSHIRPPLPHAAAHGERPHPHHGRPHHLRPWHAHRHTHHGHHWGGAFARGFIAVLIPVVAGISVGLTVSLLGLAVGRIITSLWIKYGRKRQRSPIALDRGSSFVEEGKGLMLAGEDEEEQLPAYEDAPAYEETDSKLSY